MSRFLMIDIGAGTMDILHYDTDTDLHYKAVVKSPVRYLAEKAPPSRKAFGYRQRDGRRADHRGSVRSGPKKAQVVMSRSSAA